MNSEDRNILYKASNIIDSHKWVKEIPYIKFPTDWDVKIIPNFGGSVVRFIVKKEDLTVSVYLDCYENLGYYGEPYWEIYPYYDDVFRCPMKDVESLIKAIKETIN